MGAGESEKPEKESGPSTREAVWVTAGIAILLGLAVLFTAFIIPVARTHTVVRAYGQELLSESAAVERLGGPERAEQRLLFYVSLPDWIAPHDNLAFDLVKCCRRISPEAEAARGER